MPKALTVREVCEKALQRIGAYTTKDSGADPDELERAAEWLDMVVGHLTAQQRALWLVEESVVIALTADEGSFDLLTNMGDDAPSEGVQFLVDAKIRYNGNDYDCDIIRRVQWDAISDKSASGRPTAIYANRLANDRPYLYLNPVPATADYSLVLTFQRYAADHAAKPIEKQNIDLRRSWNLWAVTATAAEIGDGPVRKMPDAEVDRIRKRADGLLFDLKAYEDQEHANEPRRTDYNDF